jgi:hypothetical protein
MPIEVIPFSGAMDLDSPDEVIPLPFHKEARNVTFRGLPPNLRIEGVPGTTEINNPLLPVVGTNCTIGRHFDQVKKRIFFFNYNSAGSHGIYIYDLLTNSFQRLIESGVGTDGDILAFDANEPITSIDIVYKDDSDGSTLHFIDSLYRPTQINIEKYLGGEYSNIKRKYINLIKAPAPMPPYCVYKNVSVASNNLKNALYQFRIRWVFDNLEKSVFSTMSKVPLPYKSSDPAINKVESNNSGIKVYFQTGDEDVRRIELHVRQIKDNVTSDWKLVRTFIKDELGISDNDIYEYVFLNDSVYLSDDVKETNLFFDWVPDKARCQALLNGNRLGFATITEGYDKVTPSMSAHVNSVSGDKVFNNGLVFFAQQGGTNSVGSGNQITLYLDGTGSSSTVIDQLQSASLVVNAIDATNTNIGFSVTASSNTIATVLTQLGAAAVVAGWSVVSTDTNSIVLEYNDSAPTLLSTDYQRGFGATNNPYYDPYTFYPLARYSYGVLYLDENGKHNGVVTDDSCFVTMPLPAYGADFTTMPQVQLTLSHRPPEWAKTYQVVRSEQLTYGKVLFWLSKSAYQNTVNGIQYAYVGIDNIETYNEQIEATKGVVEYVFSAGDRIRFVSRNYDAPGPTYGFFSVNLAPLELDYEVLSVVNDPIIDGRVVKGRFVKIYYPTSDISADFSFDGGANFQNYGIILYNYRRQLTDNALNVYYECGQEFGIINAGTDNAAHAGNYQSQSGDLATPAINLLNEGDVFFRTRTVPVGASYFGTSDAYFFGNRYTTNNMTPTSNVLTNQYQVLAQTDVPASLANGVEPDFSNGPFFWNITTNKNITIRLRMNVPLAVDDTTFFDAYAKLSTSTTTSIVTLFGASPTLVKDTSYDFNIDCTFNVPPATKVFIIFGNGNSVTEMHITGSEWRLDIVQTYPIAIVENSFSDLYPIITNSNGRPAAQQIDAKRIKHPSLFRYGQDILPGTNINGINRFYEDDYDEWDRSKGEVVRLRALDRMLRVFQERKCGQVGIYSKYIQDNQGNDTLVTTDEVITRNNIQYYNGDFGLGNQSDGLVSSNFVDYYVDPIKRKLIRLSLDGNTDLTEIYRGQTWANDTLGRYLYDYQYQFGGKSRVMGAFFIRPDKEGELIICTQAGTLGDQTISGESIVFNEAKNTFSGFYDFAPDAILCAENVLYGWRNGVMYRFDNTNNYCNFFGVQYEPSVTKVYNKDLLQKKTWMAVNEVSNKIWDCPEIYTRIKSANTVQQSNLIQQDFVELEGQFSAAFLRDSNSIGGILNGDSLKGEYVVIKFRVPSENANTLSTISLISIRYVDSPLTAVQ